MVKTRLTFLLGGYPAFEPAADAFVAACGGGDSRIALLFQNADGNDHHVPQYVDPWHARGAAEITLLGRDRQGHFDVDDALEKLQASTGIFIGGGHTPSYHELYATEPIRSAILDRYADGVPFGGMSAGAKLAARLCVVADADSCALTVLPGFGIAGELVGVHFTERQQLPHLVEAMAITETLTALGLDEPTCAVFANGELRQVIGPPVHCVIMQDVSSRRYTVTEIHGSDRSRETSA